jgi:excisionase family DNA binding protein
MDDRLTVAEAADKLGYHPNHVRRLLRVGAIKGELVGGRVWLIDRIEIERVKALQDNQGRYHHGKTSVSSRSEEERPKQE